MGELVAYDQMCRAIQAAYRVDEVKDIRDKAMALEAYAKQAKNVKAEQQACEIRLRAERHAGRLLKVMAKSKERAKPGDVRPHQKRDGAAVGPSTLADLGVSKGQSSRWQKLADVPDADFERAVKGGEGKPTTNGIIAAHAPPPKVAPVSNAALFVCGRLRDFERDGYIDMAALDVLATMTPSMIDDVARLAPKVAAWLQKLAKEAHDVPAKV